MTLKEKAVKRIRDAWTLIKRRDKNGTKMKEDLERAIDDLQEIRPSILAAGPDLQRLLWGLMVAEKELSCYSGFDNSEKIRHIRRAQKHNKNLANQAQSLAAERRIYLSLELGIIQGREACLGLRDQLSADATSKARTSKDDAVKGIDDGLQELQQEDPELFNKVADVIRDWRSRIAETID